MSLLIAILSFFVIACFVAGVALLFGGYANLPHAEKTISKEDLERSNRELKASRDETGALRSQLDGLVIQFEEAKAKLAWAEKNSQSLENLRTQGKEAQAKLEQIEKDLGFLSQKADSQAREAIDVITRLAAENEIHQRSAEQSPAAPSPEELTRLMDENQKFKIQVEGYANKVKELEALAVPQGQTDEKPAEISQAHAQLAEENAALKRSLAELEEKIKAAQGDSKIEDLKAEIDEKDGRIKKLAEELRVSKAEASVSEGWKGEKEDLQKHLKDLQKMNQYLADKEKILTFKLAQSRAQASGLEKICEEFKYQLEK